MRPSPEAGSIWWSTTCPPAPDAKIMAEADLDDLLRSSLQRDSVKDSVAHAVELSGRPRREVYARALELAKEFRDGHGED